MKDHTARVEAQIAIENTPSFKHLPRLFAFVFRSAKAMCLLFLGLSTLLSLLNPVLAFLWGRYVDGASALPPDGQLLPLIGLLLAYYAIDFATGLLRQYTAGTEDIERLDLVQRNRFQEKVDTRMYRKLAALPSEYFEVPAINDRMERVFKFTQDAWDGLNRQVMIQGYQIAAKAVSVAGISASLYILEPALCWIVLIAPLPTLYTAFVGERLKFRFAKDNAKAVREAAYFEKLMLGPAAKEMKTLGIGDFLFGKWKKIIDPYILAECRTQLLATLLNVIASGVSSLAGAAATVLAILLMTRGRLSLGALGASLALIASLLSDTGELFRSVGAFGAKKHEAAQFFDLMDLPEQRTEGETVDRIGHIEAEGLCYRYPMTERYAIEDVNVTLCAGEHVALVGENGAGKTTFVRLLCGMLTPSEGSLRVNGSAAVAPASRYGAMASVLQSPARYTTFTVAENVAIGDPARPTDDAAIGRALETAGFAEAERDALLGKDIGGTDLSGGQWQKLAIARAQYRDRAFLVLDEPTGNLDPIAEAEVFQKYLNLSGGKTLIMVTHRISVASLADRIIVFKGGRAVEDGSHEALLAQNGEYTRLYREQAKWYDR